MKSKKSIIEKINLLRTLIDLAKKQKGIIENDISMYEDELYRLDNLIKNNTIDLSDGDL